MTLNKSKMPVFDQNKCKACIKRKQKQYFMNNWFASKIYDNNNPLYWTKSWCQTLAKSKSMKPNHGDKDWLKTSRTSSELTGFTKWPTSTRRPLLCSCGCLSWWLPLAWLLVLSTAKWLVTKWEPMKQFWQHLGLELRTVWLVVCFCVWLDQLGQSLPFWLHCSTCFSQWMFPSKRCMHGPVFGYWSTVLLLHSLTWLKLFDLPPNLLMRSLPCWLY